MGKQGGYDGLVGSSIEGRNNQRPAKGEVFLMENYYVASLMLNPNQMCRNSLLLLLIHNVSRREQKTICFQEVRAAHNITI